MGTVRAACVRAGRRFNGQYCIEMVFKTFGNPTVEPTHLLVTLPRDTQNNADFSNVSDDTVDKGLMSAETTSHIQASASRTRTNRPHSPACFALRHAARLHSRERGEAGWCAVALVVLARRP